MNGALLQYEMKSKGVTTTQICKALGISRSTFSRKCNGRSQFKQKEIAIIKEVLELDRLKDIFFN